MADPAKQTISEEQAIKNEMAQLSLEQLRAWKEDRAAKEKAIKDEAERIRKGSDRVLLYGITHCYYLGRTPGKTKRVAMMQSTGERMIAVPDPEFQHSSYQFVNHKVWVPKSDLNRIRGVDFYGLEVIEALDLQDGDDRARSLEALLFGPNASEAGHAWIEAMVNRDKRMGVKPPVTIFQIENEVRQLRAGKIKAPPLLNSTTRELVTNTYT